MKAEEVKFISAPDGCRSVTFVLNTGESITRIMNMYEVIHANTLKRWYGKEARTEEFVRLFNKKYKEDNRLFNLIH